MRLLVISHTEHFKEEGAIVGWGPTVREIDHLATLFDEVVHLAPLHSGRPTLASLPYSAKNVTHRGVAPAGGKGFFQKLYAIGRLPGYARAIISEMRRADVVHVRCPSNIGLAAIVLLSVMRQPIKRWVKYAGNWQPLGRDPASYRFQRWWLKRGLHRGVVTINGEWPNQPAHVRSFLNPCLTEDELQHAGEISGGRRLTEPINLLFVGRVDSAKGADRFVQIVRRLRPAVELTANVVGDGPLLEQLQSQTVPHENITFHGWMPREELQQLYAEAHFLLLPSLSEGWPKVLSEAMSFGVVPIASDISAISQTLQRIGTGGTAHAADTDAFVRAVRGFVDGPNRWATASRNARSGAELFSYKRYLAKVNALLELDT